MTEKNILCKNCPLLLPPSPPTSKKVTLFFPTTPSKTPSFLERLVGENIVGPNLSPNFVPLPKTTPTLIFNWFPMK